MTPSLSLMSPAPEIPAAETDTFVFPASFAQQRLWFLDRLEPGNPVYNIPLSLQIEGNLNLPALEAALNEIVRRHEILRTTFALELDQPVQVVHPFVPFPLPVTDLQAQPCAEHSLGERLSADLERAFDLERGPLLRAELLRLREYQYILAMTVHHIVFDAWSRDVFFRELAALYEAFIRNQPSPLPALLVQYADFAVWQREWLQGTVLEGEIRFWREKLANAPPLLELPSDFPRPAVQSYRGARESFAVPRDITHALEQLSRKTGASFFMTLLASFQVLLYRNTGQPDILVGTPIANRNRLEIEGLIGFFVNTLVMRSRVSDESTFRQLLDQVRQTAFDAYAHQDLPFEKLVETLQPRRSLAYAPLVQVAMNYVQTATPMLELGDIRAEWAHAENNTTKFDVMLNLARSAGGLHGNVEYSTDLFERTTITRLISQFQTLLQGIAADPDTRIGRLPLLSERERQECIVEWNATPGEYPRLCLHELFEAQAARTPEAVALVENGTRMHYRELNLRADRLAHYLRSLGVSAETPVGVMMERSADLIVTLLAILKAGCAFVPLEPMFPQARLRRMLEEARPMVVLTHFKYIGVLEGSAAQVVCLDHDAARIEQAGFEESNVPTNIDNLAYILFTSGSTGQPKGVLGTHRGMVNRITWMAREYPFAQDEVCCQKTSLNFVDSVSEIFGPLSQGTPLVLLPDETVRDANLFVNALADEGVTRVTLVPSHLRALLNSGADFRTLDKLVLWTCSGEPLDSGLARALMKRLPNATLLNLYGCSEASADSTCFQVPRDAEGERVPIGRPIANTQVYILNRSLEPAPIGAAGDLYIGGAGLARGYLNQPELTGDKFIPSPFAGSSMLYKTGDLGRYLENGLIDYLGRTDLQVKVRGMRVELGDIEAALRTHPKVRDAAVRFESREPGTERLVAYVESNAPRDELVSELREDLPGTLPAHMIPTSFVRVAKLPRTPGGKVDRNALASVSEEPTIGAQASDIPRDEVESRLQRVWQRVLKLEHVGVTDDFFELGGHSLLAIVLFGEIEREFGEKLPVATLFQAPTIEKLARVLRQDTHPTEWSPLIAIQPRGMKPIFFCIHGFGGGVVGYGPLARWLGDDQPFYGLQARGQEDAAEPDATIEEMAERYIAAIEKKQPKGPYYLGGYCYGGTVAYEVARRFVGRGEEVAFLGMFENPAPKSGYRRFKLNAGNTQGFLKNLPYWAGDFLSLDWKLKWRRLERELKQRAYYRQLRTTIAKSEIPRVDLRDVLDDVAPIPLQHQALIQVHIGAMIQYQPQSYSGRVTVFRTRRQPLFCSHDPYLGWKEFASDVDVRLVSGSHHNLLEEPYVQSLAQELRACLDLIERQA